MRLFAPSKLVVSVVTLVISITAAQAQNALTPGSARYAIFQGDKVVGNADYTVQPTPNGYTVTSHGKLSLSKFSYSFNNVQYLDHDRNLVSDQLNGVVNGSPVTFTVNSDSSGRQFQINISANGKQTQNTVDRHQHLVLLPDLDPAAYVLLTRIAMENPPTSWILIPKENGILVPSSVTRGSHVRGSLNNSQMDVQHATIFVNSENSVTVDLFYTSDGSVLEADLPQQNFFVVRDGFKLINRPKPLTPAEAPQSNGPQPSPPPQYSAPQNGYPQMQQQ